MNRSEAEIRFIDGVVEYHQYRDYLELSIPKAREHENTLAVFADISEVVQSNPDLALAYTGVLKSRGQRKADAIEQVREIELDILTGLYDGEVITPKKFKSERTSLQDDEKIKERAEQFTRLFKDVIPKEALPKRPRAKRRKQSNDVEIKTSITQDTEFHVAIDQDDTVIINDKRPLFANNQDVIFRVLLEEARTSGAALAPSFIKHTPDWKQRVAGNEPSSHRLFTTDMRAMRQMLNELGLGFMIEQTGTGRGTAYLMHLDTFSQEATAKPTSTRPSIEKPIPLPQPTVKFYEAQYLNQSTPANSTESPEKPRTLRDEILAMNFSQAIVDHIAAVEAKSESRNGLPLRQLENTLVDALGIEPEAAVRMIRQLRNTGDLFISAKIKGTRYISTTEPTATIQESIAIQNRTAKAERQERIALLRETYGTQILQCLEKLQTNQTVFKTALASCVEGLSVDDVNPVCNLLQNEGLVYSKAENSRGSNVTKKGKTWGLTKNGKNFLALLGQNYQ